MTSTAIRNAQVTAYTGQAAYGAVYTTAPTGSAAGTEPTTGSYARVALSWAAATSGASTATAVFNVPAGTFVGWGVHSGATGGTYHDGGSFSSNQVAASATTLTVVFTRNQP